MDYVLGAPVWEQIGGCCVRLADSVQKCVVFLGPERGDDIHLAGTGFLLRTGGGTESTTYLVTAAHVARQMAGPFGVRMNTREGQFRVHPLERAEWAYHPDEGVDVVATVFDPPDWADTVPFHVRYFATEFKIGTKNFGPGDFAYVVGLYRLLQDTRRNIPLVHTGHIAALAADHPIPVTDERGKTTPTYGYLVESRAISGASGSPVFVRRSIEHEIQAPGAARGQKLVASTPGSVWLLGLWQSSWPRKPEQALLEGAELGSDVKVSVGIGVVVPASFILEVLSLPKLEKQRDQRKHARAIDVAASTDVATPASDENPKHREDFSRLLGEAARKRESED
jgi:hypothetical protein